MSSFRHLTKALLLKHPLSSYSFDYLGFQTQQQVINNMHGENRIAFDYNGKRITFDNNIYSWDFSKPEVLLYEVTGNSFGYDNEFEKHSGRMMKVSGKHKIWRKNSLTQVIQLL